MSENKQQNSILDKVMEAEKKSKIRSFSVAAEAEYVLTAPKIKKERDIRVVTERFGLDGKKIKTLEEIGRELGITRERVRQIEANAIRKVKDFVQTDLRGQEIISTVSNIVRAHGNAITEKEIFEVVLGPGASTKERNALRFLLSIITNISSLGETPEVKPSFYLEPLKFTDITTVLKSAVGILEQENKPLEEAKLVQMIVATKVNLSNEQILAIIELSKRILKTDSGHLGLSHWRDINPRSIKDKTYYVLKKQNKPLHYKEISEHIQNIDKNAKSVTRQAVHNELIRDDRFVLIGRGIYALREWGYDNGVVEEVIEEVLLGSQEPMHKDDIIAEVKKRRIVKDTTILLNLQKKRFKRVARATYTVSDRGE